MRALIFTILLLFATGCGAGQTQDLSNRVPPVTATPTVATTTDGDMTVSDCKICKFDYASYKGDLKKEEIDGLLLALNDEYMAWATYDRVNKDFNNPRPFSNIQRAEETHADRLKVLFKTYGVPIPENPWVGQTPKFNSVAEACKAGVDAEIANRDLYTKLFKSTAREDILVVYRALQRASDENHLPAFQRCGGGVGEGGPRGRGNGRFN